MAIIKITASQKPSGAAYGPLAIAAYINEHSTAPAVEISFSAEQTADISTVTDGKTLSGAIPVARFLARSYPALYYLPNDPAFAASVDYFVVLAQDSLSLTDFKKLSTALAQLDSHLTLRNYFVGYELSLADFAVWGALRANAIFQHQVKTNGPIPIGVHLLRWFNFVSSLDCAISAVESLKKAGESTKNNVDQGKFDIPLPDAEMGKVVTRFPPEPSGYLHIGHAKAALLNDYFARSWNGKLLLRFDDTNPSKEKEEFETSIKEDLALIGIKPDAVSHTSDHFDKLYEFALALIKKGKAYVDDTDQETMRAQRMDGIEGKCRDLSVDENLRRFKEMTDGTEWGLTACLRAKISMTNPNKAMRDPVIYRCNLVPHHITGSKYKVYPTYDFACPLVDSIEGVTHALRTNEYRDRNDQYYWMLEACGVRKVHLWDFSRLNFVYTLLSKRKLTWFVTQGLVTGWDDPRFPTVRGIRRRGLTIDALRQYILIQGASQSAVLLEWDKLWAVNKKVIDPVAPRHTAIEKKAIVKVHVLDETVSTDVKDLPKHKKNSAVGTKRTTFSSAIYLEQADARELVVDEEVTLMDWGNAFIKAIRKAADGTVQEIDIRLNLDGDFKKTKRKLTWLSQVAVGTNGKAEAPAELKLKDYDFLITKKKLEEDDDVADCLALVTEFATEAVGDVNLKLCKKGDIIQLERKGFYIIDVPYDPSSRVIELILIPDGKESTVSKAAEAAAKAAPVKGKAAKKEDKAGAAGSAWAKTKAPAPAKSPAPAASAPAPASAPKGASSAAAKAVVNGVPSAPSPIPVWDTVSQMYRVPPVYGVVPLPLPSETSQMYVASSPYGSWSAPEEVMANWSSARAPVVEAPVVEEKKEAAPAPSEEKGKKGKDKAKGKEAAPAAPKPAAAEPVSDSVISKLDIRVGKIESVRKHPDADTLYVEEIDVGEPSPRTVVSGLVKYLPASALQDRMVLVLCNLKPASMRGIKSMAMVLAASSKGKEHLELVAPPEGAKPGDRVSFEGHEGAPEEQLNPKKKVWETVQPDFSISEDLVATWRGVPFSVAGGVAKITDSKIVGGSIS